MKLVDTECLKQYKDNLFTDKYNNSSKKTYTQNYIDKHILKPNELIKVDNETSEVYDTNLLENQEVLDILEPALSKYIGKHWEKVVEYDYIVNNLSNKTNRTVYGNGIWVSFSSNAIYYSEDNTNSWKEAIIDFDENELETITYLTYTGNIFMAIINNGLTYIYSLDGKTWSSESSSESIIEIVIKECDGIIFKYNYTNRSNEVFFSLNGGETWKKIQSDSSFTYANFVCGNDIMISRVKKYNVAGYYIERFTKDGEFIDEIGTTIGIEPLAYGNYTFMGRGDDNFLYYSEDNGIRWKKITTIATINLNDYSNPVYANGTWVVTKKTLTNESNKPLPIYCSKDNGSTWVPATGNSLSDAMKEFRLTDPVYANGIWLTNLTGGNLNGICYSYDGIEWNIVGLEKTSESTKFKYIEELNTWFCINEYKIYCSKDNGPTWEKIAAENLQLPVYANGNLVAGSGDGIFVSNIKQLFDNGWFKL